MSIQMFKLSFKLRYSEYPSKPSWLSIDTFSIFFFFLSKLSSSLQPWHLSRRKKKLFKISNRFLFVFMFVNFRLSKVNRRARCAARRRVIELYLRFCCGRRALKRKFEFESTATSSPKGHWAKSFLRIKTFRFVCNLAYSFIFPLSSM